MYRLAYLCVLLSLCLYVLHLSLVLTITTAKEVFKVQLKDCYKLFPVLAGAALDVERRVLI